MNGDTPEPKPEGATCYGANDSSKGRQRQDHRLTAVHNRVRAGLAVCPGCVPWR
jgi:hypothetical protein